MTPKGEKGMLRGVSKFPGNRLKSTLWPNRGNSISKMVPSGPKVVPSEPQIVHNASKIAARLMQNDSIVVPAPSPSKVFKHTLGNSCTCTCTCTGTTFAQKRQHLHKREATKWSQPCPKRAPQLKNTSTCTNTIMIRHGGGFGSACDIG